MKALNTVSLVIGLSVSGFSAAVAESVYTWNGESSGDWNAQENWNDGADGVPGEGAVVVIPAGLTATIASSSPRYASIEVAGTLVMTNWNTKLAAETVTVKNQGLVTSAAAAENMDDMSRVWIDCGSLAVEAGGAVDVSGKGYLGRLFSSVSSDQIVSGDYVLGLGPGASASHLNVGPSHGGHGGFKFSNKLECDTLAYDDPYAPELPGSSGTTCRWGRGGSGGGAVKITASGDVSVNGSIVADGETSSSYGTIGKCHNSSGSGGSIYIVCRTISGSGTLSAAGGGGDNRTYVFPAMPAGGGCIALRYDTEQQSVAAVGDMTITVAAGLYSDGPGGYRTTNVTADKDRSHADIGTLYFADTKILDALLGKGLTGQIRGVTNYVYEGDLAFDSGHVRFATEGLSFSVTGDLVMGGDDSRLEIGGCEATNRSAFVSIYAGALPISFTVGGDLVLGGCSRLDVRAAATNSTDVFGALTKVSGTMSVGEGCFVYAWSDPVVASVPRFEVGGFYLAEGGLVSAYRGGGRAQLDYKGLAAGYEGYGFGRGLAGGGHGGCGGKTFTSNGKTYGLAYDDAERPALPGSGGGSASNWRQGGDGGAIVTISATNGTVHIAGEINADGEAGNLWVDNKCGGGGSGGTIFIEAEKFIGTSTAVLSAAGGDTTPISTHASGGGGGGRIAVWCGAPWTEKTVSSRVTTASEPLDREAFGDFFSWEGTLSVAGGVTTGEFLNEANNGGTGTVRFCHVKEAPGMILIAR